MRKEAREKQLVQRFGAREIAPFKGVLRHNGNQIFSKIDADGFPEDLRVNGLDNVVHIGKGCDLSDFKIYVRGRRHLVDIGPDCILCGSIFVAGTSHIKVVIGAGTTFADVEIYCAEHAGVKIGRDCMFSKNIEIRTSDAHGVYDAKSGQRTNLSRSIEIGDHVWIGLGALVGKGARISDNSIVAANSFVNRQFDETGVVIGGMPARVVKRDIIWDRGRASFLPSKG